MNINDIKNLTPHLIITLIVVGISFFAVQPFLGDYDLSMLGIAKDTEVVEKKAAVDSQLESLVQSIFESKQLESLISVGERLPIVEKAPDSIDVFKEIKGNKNVGSVGRHNPFISAGN